MKFLKNLFKKKKKETEPAPEEKEEKVVPEVQEKEQEICHACGMRIDKELHGQRTFNNKKFHKKCLRTLIKKGKKEAYK